MIYLFFQLVITFLSIKTVYCSTWRLGRKMSTTTKKYEPFPPKIETAILDVAPWLSKFLFVGLKKMLKFKQWLAAGGNYGRLTPAHEGAALGHCLNLNIFFKPRNKKVGKI